MYICIIFFNDDDDHHGGHDHGYTFYAYFYALNILIYVYF